MSVSVDVRVDELLDLVDRLRAEVARIPRLEDALDRVRCDMEEVLRDTDPQGPWFQGARTVARDVLDAIAGPQPEDGR